MDNRWTRAVYEHAPVVVQNAMASLYGLVKLRGRYGAEQRRWRDHFERAARWSDDEVRAWRRERLRHTIRSAWERVPFWRDRFRGAGLHPDDVRDVEDLPRLPVLEKDEIARAGRAMLADGTDVRRLLVHPTSGSTGTPLTLYTPEETLHAVYGFVWARLRPGLSFRDPYASFTGLEIVRPGADRPPFWRDNWAANQRMFSVFHLREEHLAAYARALDEQRPAYLEGYPGPIWVIADWMERHGVAPAHAPRAVFSTSEVLQPHYRRTIEHVFRTRVWDQYSQGEFCASVTEYPCGHMHVDEDYGVLELLPVGEEDGLTVADMVCTSLYNDAWPLLRYRVGDRCAYDPADRCSEQPGRVIRRIIGRTGESFRLPDGTRVTNVSVIAKRCPNIRYLQVIQERAGDIEVRVVPDAGFEAPRDADAIVAQFRRKVGPDLAIRVTTADAPILTKRGKFLSILDRTGGGGSA